MRNEEGRNLRGGDGKGGNGKRAERRERGERDLLRVVIPHIEGTIALGGEEDTGTCGAPAGP